MAYSRSLGRQRGSTPQDILSSTWEDWIGQIFHVLFFLLGHGDGMTLTFINKNWCESKRLFLLDQVCTCKII